jgi:hypothetical protein
MDVDKNHPTADLKQFLFNDNDGMMLQFLVVLPDGGSVKRFQKERDTYDDLKKFVENTRYLIKHYKEQFEDNGSANKTEL